MRMDRKNIEETLIPQIRDAKDASPRDPQAGARGRARFLAEAAQLRAAAFPQSGKGRSGWASPFRIRRPVLKAVTAALIALCLFAGAATVLAAQNSLPSQPLYGVKIQMEDAGLRLTADPSARLARSMLLAARRVQEISILVERDETVPGTVNQRLRLHIETALRLAAAQSDDRMYASLLRIQSELEAQERKIIGLQGRAPENDRPVLEQTRAILHQHWQSAGQGIEDPPAFRNLYRRQNIIALTATPAPATTDQPPQTSTLRAPDHGPGPKPRVTPTPNPTHGPGRGPGPNPSATPRGGRKRP